MRNGRKIDFEICLMLHSAGDVILMIPKDVFGFFWQYTFGHGLLCYLGKYVKWSRLYIIYPWIKSLVPVCQFGPVGMFVILKIITNF